MAEPWYRRLPVIGPLLKAPAGGAMTPISVQSDPAGASATATVGGHRITIASANPPTWFGPQQPLPPLAPDGTGGRQYDYPFGENINYIPRSNAGISFAALRGLAESLPDLRIVIEKRKDQIAGWTWDIQPVLLAKDKRKKADTDPDPRIDMARAFLRRPDRRNSFHTWLRILIEDMLVVDAATIYPRQTRGGKLYSLDVIDGSTIKQLIDVSGRAPLPDDGPAYQQILHGVVAADFRLDELMYLPRNKRSNRLYGYSPVEQIILTVNIALRRQIFNLNYYDQGTIPEGFGTLPKEWNQDQIKAFQAYFDALMSGNLADRRKLRFMPEGFKYEQVRQPPLKDQYDEWLMRIICAAFSIPPSPFVADNARATAQTIQITSSQEGIGPLKNWIKDFMDEIIQERFGFADLEFVWSGGDDIDPLEKAQETQILVIAGIKTRNEARTEYGLAPVDGGDALATVQPTYPIVEAGSALIPLPGPAGGGTGTNLAAPGAAKPRNQSPGSQKKPSAPKAKKPKGAKTPDKGRRETRKVTETGKNTLYVHRRLVNAADLTKWAKENGFKTTLEPDDMHATVAFSRTPVDWDQMPDSIVPGVIAASGDRSLARFGDAVVLKFANEELEFRWNEFRAAGASWDFPEYQPHVTLTYDGADLDLDSIEPYDGILAFGPEEWTEVKEDWASDIAEKAAELTEPSEGQPR